MAYSTPAMVRYALVPSATDPEDVPATPTNTAADLTNEQLNDAIAEADSLIDGYIGRYYAVPVELDPLGNVPSPIGYWSRTIAAYLATCTYRGSLDFSDTDPVARRYKDVLGALSDVSKGVLGLQIPDNTSGNAATGAGHAINPYRGQLFNPNDFDLGPANYDPVYGSTPYWYGRSW